MNPQNSNRDAEAPTRHIPDEILKKLAAEDAAKHLKKELEDNRPFWAIDQTEDDTRPLGQKDNES